jgi:hypothetical protein
MLRNLPVLRNLSVLAACTAALAACGGVQIKPTSRLPKPIIEAMPAHVGLVIPSDMRDFTHSETRWGVDWTVELGEGHKSLMSQVLKETFAEVREFRDLEEAKAAPGLKAIFEPRIENYSFVTARETGGRYYAVTIRYRIELYSPEGDKVDSLTLTGYGNALAKGISSGKPLEEASRAAMRDAAAKFLVQFPDQSTAQRLARNEPIIVDERAAGGAGVAIIETVPIEEDSPATVDAGPAFPPSGPSATPQATEPPPDSSPAVPKAS